MRLLLISLDPADGTAQNLRKPPAIYKLANVVTAAVAELVESMYPRHQSHCELI